jgi:signal recognition particle receptor subunit beta
LRFWDVPGKESFRAMWSNYLEEIEGLIYIVDVNRLDIENSIQILSKKFN